MIINHQQQSVGTFDGAPGAPHAFLFDDIGTIAQTGRIDNMQRHAVDLNMFTQYIAGGAGDRRDNGCLMAGKRVQQTGLAGIRLAGDNHCHAFAQ